MESGWAKCTNLVTACIWMTHTTYDLPLLLLVKSYWYKAQENSACEIKGVKCTFTSVQYTPRSTRKGANLIITTLRLGGIVMHKCMPRRQDHQRLGGMYQRSGTFSAREQPSPISSGALLCWDLWQQNFKCLVVVALHALGCGFIS